MKTSSDLVSPVEPSFTGSGTQSPFSLVFEDDLPTIPTSGPSGLDNVPLLGDLSDDYSRALALFTDDDWMDDDDGDDAGPVKHRDNLVVPAVPSTTTTSMLSIGKALTIPKRDDPTVDSVLQTVLDNHAGWYGGASDWDGKLNVRSHNGVLDRGHNLLIDRVESNTTLIYIQPKPLPGVPIPPSAAGPLVPLASEAPMAPETAMSNSAVTGMRRRVVHARTGNKAQHKFVKAQVKYKRTPIKAPKVTRAKASIVKRKPKNGVPKQHQSEVLAPLDTWQHTFLNFLAVPSTHVCIETGEPVKAKDVVHWGRQKLKWAKTEGVIEIPADRGGNVVSHKLFKEASDQCSEDDSVLNPFSEEKPRDMIRMSNTVALRFTNDPFNQDFGTWLGNERTLFAERQENPKAPPLFPKGPNDASKEEAHSLDMCRPAPKPKREDVDLRFDHMQQTFRFTLLEMCGIDLNISSDDTCMQGIVKGPRPKGAVLPVPPTLAPASSLADLNFELDDGSEYDDITVDEI